MATLHWVELLGEYLRKSDGTLFNGPISDLGILSSCWGVEIITGANDIQKHAIQLSCSDAPCPYMINAYNPFTSYFGFHQEAFDPSPWRYCANLGDQDRGLLTDPLGARRRCVGREGRPAPWTIMRSFSQRANNTAPLFSWKRRHHDLSSLIIMESSDCWRSEYLHLVCTFIFSHVFHMF